MLYMTSIVREVVFLIRKFIVAANADLVASDVPMITALSCLNAHTTDKT